jgi:hypothetical protein
LILIGAGFGPLPSLTRVAVQNTVERHQLGNVGRIYLSTGAPPRCGTTVASPKPPGRFAWLLLSL